MADDQVQGTDTASPTDVAAAKVEVPTGSPLAKISAKGILWLSLILIAAFLASKYFGWHYVTSHDEGAEKDDWDQINGIILSIDTFITLFLGGLIGAGVQSGATSSATKAAETN